jgi:hypothetical protein
LPDRRCRVLERARLIRRSNKAAPPIRNAGECAGSGSNVQSTGRRPRIGLQRTGTNISVAPSALPCESSRNPVAGLHVYSFIGSSSSGGDAAKSRQYWHFGFTIEVARTRLARRSKSRIPTLLRRNGASVSLQNRQFQAFHWLGTKRRESAFSKRLMPGHPTSCRRNLVRKAFMPAPSGGMTPSEHVPVRSKGRPPAYPTTS